MTLLIDEPEVNNIFKEKENTYNYYNQYIHGESENEIKRIAIYARVSSKEQALHGFSLMAQIEALKQYCDSLGFRYVRIYKDRGYSGKNLDRPMLQKMLWHAYYGSFDIVLVWRIDRLSRNILDLLEIVEYLKTCNILIMSSTEPFDTTTPAGECMLNLMGSFAQYERKMIIDRIKLGMRARFKKGLWVGTAPYGYTYDSENQQLKINEKEGQVVRLIFGKYLELETIRSVKNYLNKKDLLTRKGKKWSDMAINRILSRKLYIGILELEDLKREDQTLRIIEKEIFQQTQELKEKRKSYAPKIGNKNKVWEKFCHNCGAMVLEDMMYCTECGCVQIPNPQI